MPRRRRRSAQQSELDDRGGAELSRLRRFEDCRERFKTLPRTLELVVEDDMNDLTDRRLRLDGI